MQNLIYLLPVLSLIIYRLFFYVMPSWIMLGLETSIYVITAIVFLSEKFTPVKKIALNPTIESQKIKPAVLNSSIKSPKIKPVVLQASPNRAKWNTVKEEPKSKVNEQIIQPEPIINSKPEVLPEFNSIYVPQHEGDYFSHESNADRAFDYIEKHKEIQHSLNSQFESINKTTNGEYQQIYGTFSNRNTMDKAIDFYYSKQEETAQSFNKIIDEITQELSQRFERKELAERLAREEREEKERELKRKLQKEKEAAERKAKEEREEKERELQNSFSQSMQQDSSLAVPSSVKANPEPKVLQVEASQVSSQPKPPVPAIKEPAIKLEPPKEISALPKSSQKRDIPIIAPSHRGYKENIEKMTAEYRSFKVESEQILKSNIKDDLNAIVNQITSVRDNLDHLNSRIEIAINVLRNTPPDLRERAMCILCERTVSAVKDRCDKITYGPAWSLSFMDLIFSVSKEFPSLAKMFFTSLVDRRKILVPIYGVLSAKQIEDRTLFHDLNEKFDNEQCTADMVQARAYGMLLGTYYTHKDSQCNAGDCWRWLAFVLNIPEEFIDRTYLSTLEGFLKVTGNFMRENYGKQYGKIVNFLKECYLPVIKKKFEVRYQHKTFVTQLQQVINEL